MDAPTATLIAFQPVAGALYASGTTVTAKAQAKVTIPAAQGGPQDNYRITTRLRVYNETTCLTDVNAQVNLYAAIQVPKTYTASEASDEVDNDGYYLAIVEVLYSTLQADGNYGPDTSILYEAHPFKIGNPNDTQPRAFFCTANATPSPGCVGPIPANGAVVNPPGNTRIDGRYQVVGDQTSQKKYQFTFELTVTGPEPAHVKTTKNVTGTQALTPFNLITAQISKKGDYTAEATIHVQRIDNVGNPPPQCTQKVLLEEFSWGFTLNGNSSSSSSQSSSSSSQSSSSSSSQSSSSSSQ